MSQDSHLAAPDWGLGLKLVTQNNQDHSEVILLERWWYQQCDILWQSEKVLSCLNADREPEDTGVGKHSPIKGDTFRGSAPATGAKSSPVWPDLLISQKKLESQNFM